MKFNEMREKLTLAGCMEDIRVAISVGFCLDSEVVLLGRI